MGVLKGLFAPAVRDKNAYHINPSEYIVKKVLEQLPASGDGQLFRVKFQSGHLETLPASTLIARDNSASALSRFQDGSDDEESTGSDIVLEASEQSFVESEEENNEKEEEEEEEQDQISSTRPSRHSYNQPCELRRLVSRRNLRHTQRKHKSPLRLVLSDEDDNSDEASERVTRSGRLNRPPQRLGQEAENDSSTSSEEDLNLLQSDVLPRSRKRKRRSTWKSDRSSSVNGLRYSKMRKEGTRQSTRSTRHTEAMKEDLDLDELYRAAPTSAARVPKAVGAREMFNALPSGHRFVLRHCRQCDTCGRVSGGPLGQLIYCQGCTLSYHKSCIGHRASREHLVSKIGESDFVLQCRRCINWTKSKDPIAPDHAICQVCREIGSSCLPFRERKTAAQEEREREENDGKDPIVPVKPSKINNPATPLFRCVNCWRGFHFHHLPSRSDEMILDEADAAEDDLADRRFREYALDWQCLDCKTQTVQVSGLVAWRPVDPDAYVTGARVQDLNEDEKEYLVKWKDRSYFQCVWMPGAWVWGVTSHSTRRAFARTHNFNNLSAMNTEDAIPEDYLRIDIVFDVRFTSIVETRAEEVDKARIREVDRALIKYKGLGYEDVVWEKVPGPQDGDHWTDFVSAYDNWVMGRYIHTPKAVALKLRLEKARATDFNALEKKKQPEKLTGGELMKYQIDGLNWLYYRWYIQGNGILADEMGLGKTIQIIAFLATLVHDHNCFPFLVVVPNSTCPNWRREIKQWAPSLRVVMYYGSSQARSLAYQHELFPDGSKDLRCHVVVTSYDTASDPSCQRFFKSVPWQALFVDEGQRLKSDQSLLYGYLSALKVPFRILLTGTPLQNNARELFNLLHFLDDSFNAAALELEYATLTKENVPQLHDLIRPFFLRRTKAQVLTFLPPMAQIILPVSMSSLQTKLYQSILSRNPELIRVIFDSSARTVGKTDRTNLNNLLMQLRKCLCHPFVYSKQIEDRTTDLAVSHRNLVEASAKLQLLELLLPKLKEQGHRVLIFSQFLDMLDIIEDFLDGLAMKYQRLDGSMGSLQKQQRIDEFNASDSPLFAFLLSTRAGGVGINLATADTVIIMDPDFNPHQDIQALSRAHRIGQKKKVLVYQLMTRASAEEKIVQVGRKKMVLDHVLIDQMDNDEGTVVEVDSILRFGAADILEGKNQAITYDEVSIDKLLDRSKIEETRSGENESAESQFSFARVWANDTESLNDSLGSDEDEEKAPDPSVWDKIIRERERLAAEEAAMRQEALGRGKRSRQRVDYGLNIEHQGEGPEGAEGADGPNGVNGPNKDSGSDTDFRADPEVIEVEADEDDDDGEGEANHHRNAVKADIDSQEIADLQPQASTARPPLAKLADPPQTQRKAFNRATLIWPSYAWTPGRPPPAGLLGNLEDHPVHQCPLCGTWHRCGYCPFKLAGPEYCGLCGMAHYGVARSCPHIKSETQVRAMVQALNSSPESRELINLARKYLTGVKGTLVQEKKKKAERAAMAGAIVPTWNAYKGGPAPMQQPGVDNAERGARFQTAVNTLASQVEALHSNSSAMRAPYPSISQTQIHPPPSPQPLSNWSTPAMQMAPVQANSPVIRAAEAEFARSHPSSQPSNDSRTWPHQW